MSFWVSRRRLTVLLGSACVGGLLMFSGVSVAADKSVQLEKVFAKLEDRLEARMGVMVLDTQTGRTWEQRGQERFPLCSTFKVLACAALLAKVDAGEENLARRVQIQARDIVTYSPVTKDRIGGEGMTLGELCQAAMTKSDNTAANLVLKAVGGPPKLTEYLRGLGDETTRLDRWETELNEATPGDPRDTTSPAAMASTLQKLFLNSPLSSASRQQLTAWFLANETGDAKLRAGLPQDWRIGDRTGGGAYGSTNDVAVIWPQGREPLIVTVYITETEAAFDDRNKAIADIGRAVGAAFQP
ncbi:class A beta-lactamase [Hahella aquimaris]|uniref:class A beta-lactamase n=1 Tax=Hahella sp. HNIBRBA332 TaxID=3015983 RepID=UPI00273B1F56|nr:class A beta-lactamase [Hahella sp. HNIBRBA332]WLQ15334.1 class A beta-lactamase [Hahella sp. HNIBRBA332]